MWISFLSSCSLFLFSYILFVLDYFSWQIIPLVLLLILVHLFLPFTVSPFPYSLLSLSNTLVILFLVISLFLPSSVHLFPYSRLPLSNPFPYTCHPLSTTFPHSCYSLLIILSRICQPLSSYSPHTCYLLSFVFHSLHSLIFGILCQVSSFYLSLLFFPCLGISFQRSLLCTLSSVESLHYTCHPLITKALSFDVSWFFVKYSPLYLSSLVKNLSLP